MAGELAGGMGAWQSAGVATTATAITTPAALSAGGDGLVVDILPGRRVRGRASSSQRSLRRDLGEVTESVTVLMEPGTLPAALSPWGMRAQCRWGRTGAADERKTAPDAGRRRKTFPQVRGRFRHLAAGVGNP